MNFRIANQSDVFKIVALLANDQLGKKRERFEEPLPDTYYKAFERINADPNQELYVVEDQMKVIGVAQISFITYLTYQGGTRAQIEGVRIDESYRGEGIGKRLFEFLIERAKTKGSHVVQLTTDKKRPEALRFYENLGFIASHEGMKLHF